MLMLAPASCLRRVTNEHWTAWGDLPRDTPVLAVAVAALPVGVGCTWQPSAVHKVRLVLTGFCFASVLGAFH